jgi:hypothetical protein
MDSTLQRDPGDTGEMSAIVDASRGRHHLDDYATLTTSQMRVRQRITTRRLVRLLMPGPLDGHAR